MTAAPHRLSVVPAQDGTVDGCTVACQATLIGPQEICVRSLIPVSGNARPLIALRVGSILLLIADREALATVAQAVAQAERRADQALAGPPA
ncbi:hypothetical protein [Pedococcus sp. 2YAF34]|uniref:hypothetical protein n=1 Tax=Pedococcus sp. 2YAF34 TaxID=3233032 RepID=UPI003F95A626